MQEEATHVVVLLICTTLGINTNSRPSGNKVPIRWMIFFQGLQMIYFVLYLEFNFYAEAIRYKHCLINSSKYSIYLISALKTHLFICG